MSRNLAEIVAAAGAGRTALHLDGDSISYGELERRAGSAAALLRERGVGPGDRVALLIGNGAAFPAAWLGALRLGAIVVPLNPLLAPPEVEARVAASGARLLLREDDLAERAPLAEIAGCEADDPAVILYTSGTSGRPKGAILTHGGIHAAARNAADALALGPDDVMLGAAPFSHVLGQSTGLVSTFLAGAAVAVVRRFEAEQT
ncbi:MAG TPA: AMP-binding protein, partial [Gaiellaceae bacterium]|nr:AMP-binding protein [Gaiellaceae bacterium]